MVAGGTGTGAIPGLCTGSILWFQLDWLHGLQVSVISARNVENAGGKGRKQGRLLSVNLLEYISAPLWKTSSSEISSIAWYKRLQWSCSVQAEWLFRCEPTWSLFTQWIFVISVPSCCGKGLFLSTCRSHWVLLTIPDLGICRWLPRWICPQSLGHRHWEVSGRWSALETVQCVDQCVLHQLVLDLHLSCGRRDNCRCHRFWKTHSRWDGSSETEPLKGFEQWHFNVCKVQQALQQLSAVQPSKIPCNWIIPAETWLYMCHFPAVRGWQLRALVPCSFVLCEVCDCRITSTSLMQGVP